MSFSNVVHVILSGGTGSRLWPLSRKSCPKQYLEIFDGKSLFELCLERNKFLNSKGIVVGSQANFELSRDILKKTGLDRYSEIVEAIPRNTAPAIAFAAMSCPSETILLVTPSDQLIQNQTVYEKAVKNAVRLATINLLVTFGISPTHPETGYGYIHSEDGVVKGFKEKPNLETAKTYLDIGNHFWNSGMFCFKAGVFLEELKRFQPELFSQIKLAFEDSENGIISPMYSENINSISVDYAVMEHSKNLVMVEGYFEWSDLGSFEALSDYLLKNKMIEKDESGNVYIGKTRHASFLGVSNMIFVETPDAFLILDRSSCQEVKGLFDLFEVEKPELIK